MGIIDRLFNFFINREYSIKSKALWGFLLIVSIIGVNDWIGFTYYYSASKEIELISQIESTKQISSDNKELMKFLNEKESEILNRKFLYEKFLDLFERTQLENDTKNEAKYTPPQEDISIIDKVFPEKPFRSQLWHTLTSTFVQILALLFLIFYGIIAPFRKDYNVPVLVHILLMLGIIIISAGFIWLIQFLFGLIPVICNRAYLNYAIQILAQIIFIYLILKYSSNDKK